MYFLMMKKGNGKTKTKIDIFKNKINKKFKTGHLPVLLLFTLIILVTFFFLSNIHSVLTILYLVLHCG